MKIKFRLTKAREIFLIIFIAIISLIPVYISTRTLFFRLNTDYEGMLPTLSYLSDFIIHHHSLPIVNPYIGTGIPILGDPVSPALNLFLMVPVILFGAEWGVRIFILVSLVVSGLSMWALLNRFVVSPYMRLWGALLYMTCGAFAAQVVSGHFLAPYSVIPLFFLFTLGETLSIKENIGAGLVLVYSLYSGDFYQIFFLAIFFLATRLYIIYARKNSFLQALFDALVIAMTFLLFGSVKLVPFLTQVWPTMQRFFPIDPYHGSIQAFLVPLSFLLPFQSEFYDRPSVQRILGYGYNWYEYFAFISPLPFILLWKIRSMYTNELIRRFLFLVAIGVLYISLKYPYSPFYWLFHWIPLMRVFRDPSRILVSLAPLVVGFFTLCADWWMKQHYKKHTRNVLVLVMVLTLVWTFAVSQKIFLQSFESFRSIGSELAHRLRAKDPTEYYVATFVCCTQSFLVEEKIPVLNYYYAWRPQDSPNFINPSGEGTNYSVLSNVRPKYIIVPLVLDMSMYLYKPFFETSIGRVWITDRPTIVPKI